MKLIDKVYLINNGDFKKSSEWRLIENNITRAIENVKWPINSKLFTIYPQSGKKRGEGNGVKPIKMNCMSYLEKEGWEGEKKLEIAVVKRPGPFDAVKKVNDKYFAVEWETGNISSSHRAINKMLLGMLKGILIGGVLILPTRKLYKYLTDRIGNYQELEPYFDLWRSFDHLNGLLGVFSVEYDKTSLSVPRIAKGTNGRALK